MATAAALAADLDIVRKAFLDKFNTTMTPDSNTVKRAVRTRFFFHVT